MSDDRAPDTAGPRHPGSSWRTAAALARPRGHPGQRLRRPAGGRPRASRSPPRCSRPTRAGWRSCARTSSSASSTTSTRSRTASPQDSASSRPAATPCCRRRHQAEAPARPPRSGSTPCGILAGTAPATGPGIVLTIGDPDQQGHGGPTARRRSRSCATPAPRPSRSATSGRGRAPGSPTSTAGSRDRRHRRQPAVRHPRHRRQRHHGVGAWTSPAASPRRVRRDGGDADRASSSSDWSRRPRCTPFASLVTLGPSPAPRPTRSARRHRGAAMSELEYPAGPALHRRARVGPRGRRRHGADRDHVLRPGRAR